MASALAGCSAAALDGVALATEADRDRARTGACDAGCRAVAIGDVTQDTGAASQPKLPNEAALGVDVEEGHEEVENQLNTDGHIAWQIDIAMRSKSGGSSQSTCALTSGAGVNEKEDENSFGNLNDIKWKGTFWH